MKIYRPIKTNILTQSFGENLACTKTDSQGRVFVPYQVLHNVFPNSCPVGSTKLYPALGMKGHNGQDNGAWHGEPLYFPVDCPEAGGWWVKNEIDNNGGKGIDVVSKNKVGDTYLKYKFWHLKESALADGDEVELGQYMGRCDSTGISGGDHLHWSEKKCDENGRPTDPYNGYYGAQSFEDHYENVFVLDVLKVKQRALSVIDIARKVIFQVVTFIRNKKK